MPAALEGDDALALRPDGGRDVFARPVPAMIDGAPKRPPGARSETLTTRRAPLARAIHARGRCRRGRWRDAGRKATSSVTTDRAVPSAGPSAEPKATASRSRRPAVEALVKISAATERWAYGRTCSVVARERPLAAERRGAGRERGAAGAARARRAGAVLEAPVGDEDPLPVEAASRPMTKVCGAEIDVGAVHVAAVAGTATASEAAAATMAARERCERISA